MKQVDFSNGKITQNILGTAVPLLAAQLLSLLYNIVDRVYIARIPGTGTQALGSIGLCFPIIMLIFAFTSLYGMGGAPLFSIYLGQGDTENASRTMDIAFFLEVTTGIVLMLIGIVFAVPILRLFGASEAALDFGVPYIRIYLTGTVFSMIAAGMNPYINAQGFSLMGMTTVAIGAVSNLLLDPLFIFVLGFGIRGAAAATVLSQFFSALFSFRFLRGKRIAIPLHLLTVREIRHSGQRCWDIVSLGISSFVMAGTNSLVSIACNNVLAATGGDIYISIMTIISSVRQVLDTPVHALSEGASPVLSYNYGAGKPREVRKCIRSMFLMCIVCTGFIWSMILLFPVPIISVFSSDSTILADAVPALHLYFGAFIFMALQFTGQTVFKALKKKKQAIFFSLFRKVIIVIPLTYLLPHMFGLGTSGVFLAEAVSNVIGGTASFTAMLLMVLPELKRMEQRA
ncbi:MAG: MATE family efflux transporter [Eubacteriales bacterium]|nr:MATE family efflux transporter [Eubacteriales bacterium]